MPILTLGTVIAIAEETAGIGTGKATAWATTDIVSVNANSSMSGATESLDRNLFNGSFIACPSLTGTESVSGTLETELAITPVVGTEAGKLKAHLLFEAGMGVYVEKGADLTVANEISEMADPILTPGTHDLYRLSKPGEARKTLVVREYIDATKLIQYSGVVVDSIGISLSAGSIANVSFGVSGIKYETPTGQPTLTSLGCSATPFVVKNATAKVDGTTVALQEVTININNTNSDSKAITSTGISDKVTTAKSVEVSYNLDLEDLTAYTKLKNNTISELFISLVNGTDSFEIFIPKLTYSAIDKSDASGILSLSISSKASIDTAGNAIYFATKKGA